MSLKLPSYKPHSNTFMVFSMLLLGIFFVVLIVIFDFWFFNERTASIIILNKFKEVEIPLIWLSTFGGMMLISFGFFFYLISYFLLSMPVMYIRKKLYKINCIEEDLFIYVSNKTLLRFIPASIVQLQSRQFMDSFMYLLLTSNNSQIAFSARFSFTQLMFARSLASILILFSIYVCYVISINIIITIIIVTSCWIITMIFYGYGLSFYENVMTSGILIEQLYKDKILKNTKKKIDKSDET